MVEIPAFEIPAPTVPGSETLPPYRELLMALAVGDVPAGVVQIQVNCEAVAVQGVCNACTVIRVLLRFLGRAIGLPKGHLIAERTRSLDERSRGLGEFDLEV